MASETTAKVATNAITKGDVLGAARVAGIQAAKRTSDLFPYCYPVLVGQAMTACAVAALTVYDMCKSSDRSMSIGELQLWEKSGGRSGSWRRPDDSATAPSV